MNAANPSFQKILWVVPKWPLPATDGARIATESLVTNVIKAGGQIGLLCLGDEKVDTGDALEKWHIESAHLIVRRLAKNSTLKLLNWFLKPSIPITFVSFADKELKLAVGRFLQDKYFDIVVLDGLHLGFMFEKNGRFEKPANVKKIIYRAHNVEFELWKEAASHSRFWIKKALLQWQARRVMSFEKKLLDSVDGIAPISREDLEILSKLAPGSRQAYTPLGLDFAAAIPQYPAKKTALSFLFVGRLDWPPNREGLLWLLQDIWPEVLKRRPDATLKIVGSGNGEWLNRFSDLQGVLLLKFVPSVKEVYHASDFVVVPMTFGSGTRIKVVESFVMGKPLISTTMGVQGAELKEQDYIRADTTAEWIETLSTIQLTDEILQNAVAARERLKNIFDQSKIGEKFYRWATDL